MKFKRNQKTESTPATDLVRYEFGTGAPARFMSGKMIAGVGFVGLALVDGVGVVHAVWNEATGLVEGTVDSDQVRPGRVVASSEEVETALTEPEFHRPPTDASGPAVTGAAPAAEAAPETERAPIAGTTHETSETSAAEPQAATTGGTERPSPSAEGPSQAPTAQTEAPAPEAQSDAPAPGAGLSAPGVSRPEGNTAEPPPQPQPVPPTATGPTTTSDDTTDPIAVDETPAVDETADTGNDETADTRNIADDPTVATTDEDDLVDMVGATNDDEIDAVTPDEPATASDERRVTWSTTEVGPDGNTYVSTDHVSDMTMDSPDDLLSGLQFDTGGPLLGPDPDDVNVTLAGAADENWTPEVSTPFPKGPDEVVIETDDGRTVSHAIAEHGVRTSPGGPELVDPSEPDPVGRAGEEIFEAIDDVLNWSDERFDELDATNDQAGEDLQAWGARAGRDIDAWTAQAGQDVERAGADAANEVDTYFSNVARGAELFGEEVVDTFSEENMARTGEDIEYVFSEESIARTGEDIENLPGDIEEMFSEENMQRTGEDIDEFTAPIGEQIEKDVEAVGNDIDAAATDVANAVETAADDTLEWAEGAGEDVLDFLGVERPATINNTGSTVGDIFGPEADDAFTRGAEDTFDFIGDTTMAGADALYEAGEDTVEWVDRAATDADEWAMTAAADVETAATDTVNAIDTAATDTVNAIDTAATDTVNAIDTAATDTVSAVDTAATDVADDFDTAAKDVGNFFGGLFGG